MATHEHPIGESRWPAALVVLGFMVVNAGVRIAFPRDGVISVPWLAPVLEAALVVLSGSRGSPSGSAIVSRSSRRPVIRFRPRRWAL